MTGEEVSYPILRRYIVAIIRTLERIDAGQSEEGDLEAMAELEEYFDRLDDEAHEQVVKQAIFAVAREEMKRQGGERLQPGLRVVRDNEMKE